MLASVSELRNEDDEMPGGHKTPISGNYRRVKLKNESMTFRLDSNAINRLRKEATEKDISVNTLVNQVIRQHVGWHSIAPKAGFISVRRALIMKLIDKLTDEEIKSMAEHIGRTSNRDFLMLLKNKITIECALDFIESWLRASGFGYRHETTRNFGHSYVIQHDMGRKWSLYLAELYRHLFRECKAGTFTYEARDNTLSFVLETIPARGHYS